MPCSLSFLISRGNKTSVFAALNLLLCLFHFQYFLWKMFRAPCVFLLVVSQMFLSVCVTIPVHLLPPVCVTILAHLTAGVCYHSYSSYQCTYCHTCYNLLCTLCHPLFITIHISYNTHCPHISISSPETIWLLFHVLDCLNLFVYHIDIF